MGSSSSLESGDYVALDDESFTSFLNQIQPASEDDFSQYDVDFSTHYVLIGVRSFSAAPFWSDFQFTNVNLDLKEISPQKINVRAFLTGELNEGHSQPFYHIVKVERPDQELHENLFNFTTKMSFLR